MKFRLEHRIRPPGFSIGLSVLAHVVVVAAAMDSTARSNDALQIAAAQRLRYLPPPDRRASTQALAEHLQFVDVGGGVVISPSGQSSSQLRIQGGPRPEMGPGGNAGKEELSQRGSAETISDDSVYSVLEVEEQAVRTPGSAAPAYPYELMKSGIEGSAFIRFVVDTTGRAEPASMVVLSATHEPFALSVKTALPLMTFSPALVNGHPVRQAVEQNFRFKLPPRPKTDTTPIPPLARPDANRVFRVSPSADRPH